MSEGVGGKKASAMLRDEVTASDAGQLRQAVASWLGKKKARDYVAVQAYLMPSPEYAAKLRHVAAIIRDRLGGATTIGFGPRFLHSTGQLHKGGPNSVLVLQIVDRPADNLAVPETNYTFDALIQAQALGDLAALRQRRRRVLRVNLGGEILAGLDLLAQALQA
jgi:transaldolase/glucose-6-phosphate isomerase